MNETVKNWTIGPTDVILINYNLGQGKIIISDDEYGYNFSHYWGSMGKCTLEEFISDVSFDYFINKLTTNPHGEIKIDETFAEIRRYWKEESGIKWYREMEFQKDFRFELRALQDSIYDDRHFVDTFSEFSSRLDFYLIENEIDRKEMKEAVKWLTSEPWNFIVQGESNENIWLKNFLGKLQNRISEENKRLN